MNPSRLLYAASLLLSLAPTAPAEDAPTPKPDSPSTPPAATSPKEIKAAAEPPPPASVTAPPRGPDSPERKPGAPRTPDPFARLEQIRQQVGLSDEQLAEIKPLLTEEFSRMRDLRADTSLSEEEKRFKAREISATNREKIGALLSPEQREKLAEVMRTKGAERPPGPPPSPEQRLAEMKEKLGLSEEQTARLKTVLTEDGPKMRATLADGSLSQEDKRAVMKQHFERIGALLTPEQRKKFREELEARRR